MEGQFHRDGCRIAARECVNAAQRVIHITGRQAPHQQGAHEPVLGGDATGCQPEAVASGEHLEQRVLADAAESVAGERVSAQREGLAD